MDGFGPTQIAKQLAAREVLTPAAYFESRGIGFLEMSLRHGKNEKTA